jgi:hypothetical protein
MAIYDLEFFCEMIKFGTYFYALCLQYSAPVMA